MGLVCYTVCAVAQYRMQRIYPTICQLVGAESTLS